MHKKTNKLEIKLWQVIAIILIILAIITTFVKFISQNDLINKTIISGRDIAKNEATVTFDTIEWIQDVDSDIGSITIEDQGKTIKMIGNETLAGKNAIYYIPESHQQQIFSFDYNVDYGDSFISAGVLLRVKQENNILRGYMISFNNPNAAITGLSIPTEEVRWYNVAGDKLGAIWEFTYTLNDNNHTPWSAPYTNGIQKTLLKGLDLPQSGSMTITSNPNQIIITGTDINETIDISLDDDVGEGFGFFSNHYTHSCQFTGQFDLTNCSFTTIDIEPHNLYVDPNGGTWNETTEVSTIEGEYGDEVEIPIPTRPGYDFAGWTQTGNSGTMSSLTEDAIYTFGEDATIDDTLTAQWTKLEVSKEFRINWGEDYGDTIQPDNTGTTYVKEGEEIIYTIRAKNTGTTDSTIIIKDTAPEGTIFVEGSGKVNGTTTSYTETFTESDLANGVTVPVLKDSTTILTFRVKINELEKGTEINNTATYKNVTISTETEEKETNRVQAIYFDTKGEPILTKYKTATTERGNSYVSKGEKITYTINISNIGLFAEDVEIKDTIPEGTTFVDGSIKVNGTVYTKDDGSTATATDLQNGITISVPAETTNYPLSFEVTVNELEDETTISNTATVNGTSTNTTTTKYGGSSITANKVAETQLKKSYVVHGEKITYKIIMQNQGSIEKEVIVKDAIPEGTTFVEGSIKVDDKAYKNTDGLLYSAEDLESGIPITIPRKSLGSNIAGEKILSFEVTVNVIKGNTTITNIATIDNEPTNESSISYVDTYVETEPIITQTKEMETEKGNRYVTKGEKIKYTITVKNEGDTEKEVVVKDTIPEGTTFVEESIKINESTATDNNGKAITEKDLEIGIIVNVIDETKISFEVIVGDLQNGQKIENTAIVDENSTNTVSIEYLNNTSTNPNDDSDTNPDNNPGTNPDDDSDTNPDNNNPGTNPDGDSDTNPDDDKNTNNPGSNSNNDDENSSTNNGSNSTPNTNQNNGSGNVTNNNSNNNTGTNLGNTNNGGSTTGGNTTTAQEDIPKTGLRNTLIIIAIISLSIIIFYTRYKYINTYVK